VVLALGLIASGALVPVRAADAAAPGSLPFEVIEVYDNGIRWQNAAPGLNIRTCRYFVLAAFDGSEAFNVSTPDGPRPHIMVSRPNWPEPRAQRVFAEIPGLSYQVGNGPNVTTQTLPPIVAPPGKLLYVWYGLQTNQDQENDFAPTESQCRQVQVLRDSGQSPANARNLLGLYPTAPVPEPRCEITLQSGPGGSEIDFRGSVDNEDGDGYLQEWTFSDGTTSTANLVSRTATEPGTFTGTFRIWRVDEDFDRSATCEAEVEAPPLEVSVRLEDERGEQVDRLQVGQQVDAVVRLGAGSGVGALTEVRPLDELVRVSGGFEVVESPEAPDPAGLALEPGESVELRWKLEAVGAGSAGVSTEWTALDAIGREVGPVRGEVRTRIDGLRVSVQQVRPVVLGEDNNDDGEIDEADEIVDIDLTIENTTDEPITSVGPTELSDPLQFRSRISGLNVRLEPLELPAARIAQIDGGGSVTLRYRYRALDRVSADIETVIRGVQDGREVAAVGEGRVSVGKDLWVEVSIAPEARPYLSGQTVRLNGTIENVTEVRDAEGAVIEEGFPVGILLEPTVAGNAGGGHVFNRATSARTPTSSTAFLLDVGERLDIGAVLGTLEVPESTTAEVSYRAHVWRHDVEEGEDPEPGDESNVAWVRDGASSDSHTIPLGGVALQGPDPLLRCPAELTFLQFTSCRFSAGAFKFAQGSWDLVKIVAFGGGQVFRGYYGVVTTKLWAQRQMVRWMLGDEQALLRLAQEIAIDLQALKEVGVQSLQGVSVTAESIVPAVADALDSMDRILRSGDLRAIVGGMAQFAGENADAVAGLGVLVRKRVVANTLAGAAGVDNASRTALQESLQEQTDSLARRVADARTQGVSITKGGVLRSGDDVTSLASVWKAAYGARAQDVKNLLKIAADEDVILAFRSRSPRSAELLDSNQAWPKPSGVSIKTVNDLDRKYLGYRDEWDATAVLVEPPVKWAPPGPERTALVEAYLDRFGALSSPSDFSRDLRAAVKARLESRLDEWPKQLQKFSQYAEDGIDVNFYADKNGLGSRLIPNNEPNRTVRIVPDEIGASVNSPRRAVFRLEMAGPDGGDFRPIVGDIDFLGVFHRDGSLVTDITKRVRIYTQLRSLVGMQHGESFTFSGNETLREEFLRCCTADGEAMLAATPDERLLATFFEDDLSVLTSGPNAAMATNDARSLLALPALTTEANSSVTASKGLALPTLTDYLVDFVAGKIPHSPGEIAKVLADLEKRIRETQQFDRRQGDPLRPNRAGQLEIYRPPTAAPPRTQDRAMAASARGFTAASEAGADLVTSATRAGGADTALATAFAEVVAAGYQSPLTGLGAQGGRWEVIDPEEVLGDRDQFAILPTTYLGEHADVGETTLDILTPEMLRMDPQSPFFRTGDRIVVDPGGPYEEFGTIAAVGEEHLELAEPLRHPHDIGTMVLLPERTAGSVDPDPDEPAPPTTSPPTPAPPTTSPPDDGSAQPAAPKTPEGAGTSSVAAPGDPAAGAASDRSALARTGIGLRTTLLVAFTLILLGSVLVLRRRRTEARPGTAQSPSV
jgi:hypothetical protein